MAKAARLIISEREITQAAAKLKENAYALSVDAKSLAKALRKLYGSGGLKSMAMGSALKDSAEQIDALASLIPGSLNGIVEEANSYVERIRELDKFSS